MNPKPKLIETNNSAKCAYFVQNVHKNNLCLLFCGPGRVFMDIFDLTNTPIWGKKSCGIVFAKWKCAMANECAKKALKPPTPAIYFQPLC